LVPAIARAAYSSSMNAALGNLKLLSKMSNEKSKGYNPLLCRSMNNGKKRYGRMLGEIPYPHLALT